MAIDEEITLKKMEVFLSFMKLGNMTKVSEHMGLSAVSVHRALHSLEEGLRCPLFRKDGRVLIPLATAYAFAEHAARCVEQCEEGVRKAREAAGFGASRIKIGCAYSLTVRTIPQLVYGLKTRRAELDVDITLGSTRELMKKMKDDELDAVIVVMVDEATDPELTSLTLFQDEVCFAAAMGSPYADREQIDLAEMANEKFVALQEDFLTTQSLHTAFGQAGITPNIVMRASNLFALANLVAEGFGYGLLPRRVGLFTTQVQLIPLQQRYAIQQQITLLIPKVRERNPNLLELVAQCRSMHR